MKKLCHGDIVNVTDVGLLAAFMTGGNVILMPLDEFVNAEMLLHPRMTLLARDDILNKSYAYNCCVAVEEQAKGIAEDHQIVETGLSIIRR